MDKDYKLAEHLIAHLQQDDVLAPMVCPTVWDEQEQIDAINRAAMGRPGSVAVTPAGYVPLLEMGVNAPPVIKDKCPCGHRCRDKHHGYKRNHHLPP